MNRYLLAGLIVFALFGTACTSITKDIRVGAEADPFAKFGKYETYAWLGSAQIVYDPIGKWEPPDFDSDAEVKFLIDRELRKKGMIEDRKEPDLLVGYMAGIDMAAMKLKKNPETDKVRLENVPVGGVAIMLVDTATGYVVWLGYAAGKVRQDQPTIPVIRERLDYAVTHMFELLPEELSKRPGGSR
jgi:hypothetical protein